MDHNFLPCVQSFALVSVYLNKIINKAHQSEQHAHQKRRQHKGISPSCPEKRGQNDSGHHNDPADRGRSLFACMWFRSLARSYLSLRQFLQKRNGHKA